MMTITVSKLITYPLKSAAGIMAEKGFKIDRKGLAHDRQWMLVHAEGDRKGKFISQRDRGCGKLALVTPEFDYRNVLSFSAPGMDPLGVMTHDFTLSSDPVHIWDDECPAMDGGEEAAQWFSEYLDTPVRLVKMPANFERQVDMTYARAGDSTNYADGFPLLVTSTASLDSLQAHFEAGANIGMERFRPNIVLDGLDAFQEDVIEAIVIGDAVCLEFVKPCSRCVLTTIDQDKGEKTSKEPLQTLAKMRRGKADGLQGVFFGQNAVVRETGVISVGDTVEILDTKSMHPALENAALKYEP